MTRDDRQAAVYDWVRSTFGEPNAHVTERVLRLFEEVVELAQAEEIIPDRLFQLIAHVYGKPPGDPAQEVGGIGTTLLAYAAAKGLSADALEEAELRRVLSIDPDYFRRRHNAKAAAGVAEPAPESDPSPVPGAHFTREDLADMLDDTTEPAPPVTPLPLEDRLGLLVHAAQSEVLEDALRVIDSDGWWDGPLHEYRTMLENYFTEKKRQTDSCEETTACGLLDRLTKETE